jgi:L,D-transpeptidase ErfK/SrfK
VWNEETFARKPIPSFVVPTRNGVPVETVIGQPRTRRIHEGDTLLDIARYYDLGYNEIVDANPGMDPWVPPVGATVVLPSEWVLPCCTYRGLVVNIPEMRLYLYRPAPERPDALVVHTYPVGLGRDDRPTPRGPFTVRGKTVNPVWVIPASIRAEHMKERGDARTAIPGGHPDNPLGKYRLELTIPGRAPRYAIHGTNIPWGVGMQVSHGCSRLYPEDMERLFPLVAVGTPGEYAYQTVKAGTRGGAVYVEVHRDIYRHTPHLAQEAARALWRGARGAEVDRKLLATAVGERRGVPVRVMPAARRRPAVTAAAR